MIVQYQANLLENLPHDIAKPSFNLLTEEETDLLSGEMTKRKNLYLNGICIQADIKNHNERIYPLSEIKNAVNTINEKIDKHGPVCSEADHPEELTINIDRVGAIILKMWMEGTNGMGKLKILNTPKGNIIRTLIESGVKLGVSSRGVGNVDDRGYVSQFEIITIDVVVSPSGINCYPKPVFETLTHKRERVIQQLAEAVNHDTKAQKYLTKELLDAIRRL